MKNCVKFWGLAFIAMVCAASFTACDDDDEDGVDLSEDGKKVVGLWDAHVGYDFLSKDGSLWSEHYILELKANGQFVSTTYFKEEEEGSSNCIESVEFKGTYTVADDVLLLAQKHCYGYDGEGWSEEKGGSIIELKILMCNSGILKLFEKGESDPKDGDTPDYTYTYVKIAKYPTMEKANNEEWEKLFGE